jgi:hypothetical protein
MAYNFPFIPCFIKIGRLVQKLKWRTQMYRHISRQAYRQTHTVTYRPIYRQHGDLISLHFSLMKDSGQEIITGFRGEFVSSSSWNALVTDRPSTTWLGVVVPTFLIQIPFNQIFAIQRISVITQVIYRDIFQLRYGLDCRGFGVRLPAEG